MKSVIIPSIIGATRIVTKRFTEKLEAIPGRHSVDSLQKRAILVTTYINPKYCSLKPES